MNVKQFAASLASSLVERGIDKSDAVSRVVLIVNSLNEEDLKEVSSYNTPEDFRELSDSLALMIKEEKTSLIDQDNGFVPSVSDAATAEIKIIGSGEKTAAKEETDLSKTKMVTVIGDSEGLTPDDANAHTKEVILSGGDISNYHYREKVRLSARGKLFFGLITTLTFPLWGAAALILFAFFIVTVGCVSAIIGALMAVVVAMMAAGGAGALIGMIYGTIKIVDGTVGVGIFEIGLGLVILGAALASAVLIYNFAVHIMPRALKDVWNFWGYLCRRLLIYVDKYREECNKL